MTNKPYKALVTDRIFFGGVDAIEELMANEKIDVIFDLRAEVEGSLPSNVSIHQPLLDGADEQDNSIREAVNKVMEAYKEGKNVYFHCNTGKGRGGTLAAATLIELGKAENVEEAELMTQAIRPETNIKPAFKEALNRLYG